VANNFTEEDDALLEELGVEVEARKETGRTARDERVIAGFEEIQRSVAVQGWVRAGGNGPPQRSAAASREVAGHLTRGA
jgi:hypothetical protein